MRIRRAGAKDAVKIKNVHAASIRGLCGRDYGLAQIAAWSGDSLPRHYREAVASRGSVLYLALSGSSVAGFVHLFENEIKALYVHPRWAGKGVGARLLGRAELAARKNRFKTMRLNSTLTALPFYERHGFARGRKTAYALRNGVRIACVPMEKKLLNFRSADGAKSRRGSPLGRRRPRR